MSIQCWCCVFDVFLRTPCLPPPHGLVIGNLDDLKSWVMVASWCPFALLCFDRWACMPICKDAFLRASLLHFLPCHPVMVWESICIYYSLMTRRYHSKNPYRSFGSINWAKTGWQVRRDNPVTVQLRNSSNQGSGLITEIMQCTNQARLRWKIA